MNLRENNEIINKKLVISLLSILFVFSFYSLFLVENHSLIAHDESLYANRAKLIIDTNNWFTPFGKAHHKTIGSYWLIALSFKLFGISEFSARLPSYIFSILSLFLLFKIIKNLSNYQVGLISIFTLSSSFLWFSYSNYCSPDTLYIFLNLISIFSLLKLNNSLEEHNKNKYLFISGLFFSLPFFVRSYMQLLPLISLSPLILFKIKKLRYNNIRFFILGFLVGLIPLIIFYFISFRAYGISSLVRPFLLLQQKTLIENDIFEGLLFYPRNILLFSTPFFIFIINGTRYILRNKSIEVQILCIYSPFVSIIFLMLTASTYSHYGLFTIPLLASNASFGIYDSFINRTNISKFSLRIFGGLILLMGATTLYGSIFNFNLKTLNEFSLIEVFLISVLSLISIFLSFSFIYKTNLKFLNINKILSIFFIQTFILSLFFAKGLIGNPNNDIKDFIYQNELKTIIKKNPVYIIGKIDNKNLNLFQFYLPNYKLIKIEEIPSSQTIFGIISDKNIKKINDSIRFQFLELKGYQDLKIIKIN